MFTLRSRWVGATLVVVSLAAAVPARADEVQLAAVADNSLFSEDGSLSNGAGSYIFTGSTDAPDIRRALIRFDVAGSLPAGATIDAVSLGLYLSRTQAGEENVSLHRALREWGEGTSQADGEEGEGAPATLGDSTWSHALWDTVTWTSPGGDYEATASATTSVPGNNGPVTWTSTAMVADVQTWLDSPGDNFGWFLIGNEGAQKTAKRFDGRHSADSAQRPVLIVTFTPAPMSSPGACCSDDGSCTVADDDASCPGSYQGDDTTCTPNPCPAPTGACCLPDASATCLSDTEAGCIDAGGTFEGALTACTPNPCPVVLSKYQDPLPRPKVATPTSGASGGTAEYDIAIRQTTQQLHAGLPPTTVWGYDDGTGTAYPGPTIVAHSGQPVHVTWWNDLRDAGGAPRTDHYLDVDMCLHGASDTPKTVVHLHGGHVPADSDGHPEATFGPGQSDVYSYPNQQQAATLWYHDHALGITRLNVYMGLAGFYLIHDDTEQALGLPSGDHDVPLAIQDRTFRPDGSLFYPSQWQEQFFGDTILVNGKAWPYLEVDRGQYRFRVLNGSNSRTYTLALSNGQAFQVIGNDGGLLDAPVTVSDLTLTAGERAEIIIDFGQLAAGTTVELTNSAPAEPGGTDLPEVMQFRVTSTVGHTDPLPATLTTVEPIDEADAVTTRDFVLRKHTEVCEATGASQQIWLINGLHFDDVTEMPVLGTSEVWRFANPSGMMHPMHMHLVFFQVLDRQPFEMVGGEVTPTGSPVPPAREEAGWKDTVRVGPGELVRVIARFEDYPGLFPYHCHILEHEDHEMMRQFQTVVGPLPDGGGPVLDGSVGDDAGVGGDAAVDGAVVGGDASVTADAGVGGDAAVDSAVVGGDAAVTADGSTVTEGGGGCGCRVTGPAGADVPVALWILLGLLGWRWRARATT
jgi:spore coat protein A, manganese oxidase